MAWITFHCPSPTGSYLPTLSDISSMRGLGTTLSRDNYVAYCSDVLDKPPPFALENVTGARTRDNEALNLVISIMRFIP